MENVVFRGFFGRRKSEGGKVRSDTLCVTILTTTKTTRDVEEQHLQTDTQKNIKIVYKLYILVIISFEYF